MEVEEKEDTNVDDDIEIFHDPSAEFLADVRNVLGDLVHSDQVNNNLLVIINGSYINCRSL